MALSRLASGDFCLAGCSSRLRTWVIEMASGRGLPIRGESMFSVGFAFIRPSALIKAKKDLAAAILRTWVVVA